MQIVTTEPAGEPLPDFDDFYRAEWPRAVRLGRLLTQDAAAGEDVAQEAFSRVYPRFDDLDAPGAYLHTTIVNTARRWHRRREGERQRLPLLTTAGVTLPQGDDLSDAVAALPYKQRVVVVLRYYADLSEAEIADALGCRPGTVKSLASRALAQLEKVIER